VTAKSNKKPAKKPASQPLDPSLPLKSAKQESFCQNMVNADTNAGTTKRGKISIVTISPAKAYIKAGYATTEKNARRAASRLLTNVDVHARLSYLKQQLSDRLAEEGVAGKIEACAILSDIMRDDDEQATSRIQSVKALAEISGWNKKDENDEDAINVQKRFLDLVLARNADREKTPLTG